MKNLILMAAILIAYPVFPQDGYRPPTQAACRTDQATWHARLNAPAKSWATTANSVTARELIRWQAELTNCESADATRMSNYGETMELIRSVLEARRADFMDRHELEDQFLSEDAAGER